MALSDSVQTGLDALGDIDPRDRAVADLALRYAEALDVCDAVDTGEAAVESVDASVWASRSLSELGPKLLAALTALRLTPAARAAAVKGDEPGPKKSPLDELRERRAARTAP